MCEQTIAVDTKVFHCGNKACGWPLGVVVMAGNVSVLKLTGPTFEIALRKSEDVKCRACGSVTRWYRDAAAK